MVSCSSRLANSKSESASSRRGGKPSEQYGDGSAQSVHSRAMLKLPRSNSRSRRVSIPANRRAFKTSKRWPRSGWNGWRISAHPKCELRSGAVRADRRYPQPPFASARFGYLHPPHGARHVGPLQQLIPDHLPVRLEMFLEFGRLHPVDPRRAPVADYRFECRLVIFRRDDLFHQVLVHCSPSRGSQKSHLGYHRVRLTAAAPLLPLPAHWGSDRSCRAPRFQIPLGVPFSSSSSFVPWSFGPLLRRHYPASSLLRPLLTSPPLSRRRSPQGSCRVCPLAPPGFTLCVLVTFGLRCP